MVVHVWKQRRIGCWRRTLIYTALPRGTFQRRGDVAVLQQRMVGQDLSAVGAGGQEVQHVPHAD